MSKFQFYSYPNNIVADNHFHNHKICHDCENSFDTKRTPFFLLLDQNEAVTKD